MEIKVLEKAEGCLPKIIKKGDWIDLMLAEDVVMKAPCIKKLRKYRKDDTTERIREVTFDFKIASLGVCMEMPKGYEAMVLPRSSTFKRYGVTLANSEGVIDGLFCGNDDVWGMPLIAYRNTTIPKGTRVAQFRIQLSQKATIWQKIKWLFSSSIKIKKVNSLDNEARGGFGEGTGK